MCALHQVRQSFNTWVFTGGVVCTSWEGVMKCATSAQMYHFILLLGLGLGWILYWIFKLAYLVILHRETCLRQPPVGLLCLPFIERWLHYRGRLQWCTVCGKFSVLCCHECMVTGSVRIHRLQEHCMLFHVLWWRQMSNIGPQHWHAILASLWLAASTGKGVASEVNLHNSVVLQFRLFLRITYKTVCESMYLNLG